MAAAAVETGERERHRVADRLRAELRRIGHRDFFPPPQRDAALAAVRELDAVRATPKGTAVSS